MRRSRTVIWRCLVSCLMLEHAALQGGCRQYGATSSYLPREDGDATINDVGRFPTDGGAPCRLLYDYPVPFVEYYKGLIGNAGFDKPKGHLGEDLTLSSGGPVQSIGPGLVVWYGPGRGQRGLTAVIEHDLGEEWYFTNENWETVEVRRLLSIYGSLERSPGDGYEELRWRAGDRIFAGSVIGYGMVAHERAVHLGIRLMGAEQAQGKDPSGWFRAADPSGQFIKDFVAPSEILENFLKPAFTRCAD